MSPCTALTFAAGTTRRIGRRPAKHCGTPKITPRRANEPVQTCLVDHIRIDQEKLANAKVAELLDDDRTRAAQSDDGDPHSLDGALTLVTEGAHLPVMDKADRRVGRYAIPGDDAADLADLDRFC
jgi:hypothetical protein